MKKKSNNTLNDVLFLVVGVFLVATGYSIISALGVDINSTPNTKWWGFGTTLLGGLILGKWLSDFFISRTRK